MVVDGGATPPATEGGEEDHADDDHEAYPEDAIPILHQHGGIDEHSHRDEEDGGEDILQRCHQVLDALGLHRLGKD